MNKNISDWKDIAQSYYEKSLSLAVLILLFSFLVSPKMEIKAYHREVSVIKTIELPPEIKERIKPPEQAIKPQIQIIVDEDELTDDDEDIEIIETIASTTLDPYEVKAPPEQFGKTSKFVVFEDAPVRLKVVPPVYPDFAKRSGIEGDVWVEAEILISGKVGAVEIIQSLQSGPGGLDEAAINAVKTWTFSPAKSVGKPVACWVTFPVSFSLD